MAGGDMPPEPNNIRGGRAVPLKFEVFSGVTELTNTSVVASFTAAEVGCSTLAAAGDPVEVTSTGGTSLRYDTTEGQFVQNWKTPTTRNKCYQVTLTTTDGSTLSALFKTT